MQTGSAIFDQSALRLEKNCDSSLTYKLLGASSFQIDQVSETLIVNKQSIIQRESIRRDSVELSRTR